MVSDGSKKGNQIVPLDTRFMGAGVGGCLWGVRARLVFLFFSNARRAAMSCPGTSSNKHVEGKAMCNSMHNIVILYALRWPSSDSWTCKMELFRFELSPKLDSGADSSPKLSLIGEKHAA